MLTDSHIHVGQYFDIYLSPERLIGLLEELGIDRAAVSSTTTCEGDYPKVIREMTCLLALAPEKILPVLWVLPELLDDREALDAVLDAPFVWRCLKIHPDLNPESWGYDSEYIHLVVALARRLHLPLLIHTGGNSWSNPGCFERIIRESADITFVLAHCRPVEDAIRVMTVCPNAWGDTAFTPIDDIRKLLDAGLCPRMLWGSDLPVMEHYSDQRPFDFKAYYSDRISGLKSITTSQEYADITENNFIFLNTLTK